MNEVAMQHANHINKIQKNKVLTKCIDPQMRIDWGEESIHEMNEPPCGVECDG